jgi:hypothetical protein
MTSLIAWAAVDSTGPTAVYFASDSRISWGASAKWDFGAKLYHANNYPDIFGYCGDVLFPSQILSRLVALINAGLLFSPDDVPKEKFNKARQIIEAAFSNYPEKLSLPFTILHCARFGSGNGAKFELRSLSWNSAKGFSALENYVVPPIRSGKQISGLVVSLGSGHETVNKINAAWQESDVSGTSRSIFSAFCDALRTHEDPQTGGAPQLVVVRRALNAQALGVVFGGRQYFSGFLTSETINKADVDWYNESFERCDPSTGLLLSGAQRQPRPRNMRPFWE